MPAPNDVIGCPFCGLESFDRVVAANGFAFAIRDTSPVTHLHTLVLPNAAGEETGLRPRTMGVVDPPSDFMDLRPVNLDSKNYHCRTYTPSGRRGNGTPTEDDGGGRSTIRFHGFETGESRQQKLSLQDLYTPRPARNGTPVKGRWGWVDVDVGGSEKISLQDLYPRDPISMLSMAYGFALLAGRQLGIGRSAELSRIYPARIPLCSSKALALPRKT
jgi:hypothetical protein